MNRKKIITWFLVLLVIAINLFFGLPRLSKYSAVDEPYWTYERTPDFWRAVSQRKWKNTKINDKPGITTAIISGAGLLSIDPMLYKPFRTETKSELDIKIYEKINFSFRLPIYLACLLFLIAFFLLLRKLFNDFVAAASVILIGLSPIILGISLFVNPDSLLWALVPLTILSYLVYQKENKKRYLILTGILLGLSLLTKYVANILYVYLLGLVFLNYIYNFSEGKNFAGYIKKAMLDYGIIVALSLATFFVLFPATWLHPKMVLEGTILSDAFKSTWPIFVGFIGAILADMLFLKSQLSGFVMGKLVHYRYWLKTATSILVLLGIIFILFNVFSGMSIFNFEAEMASPKGGANYSFWDFIEITSADFYALLFGLSPFVALSFFWAILKQTFNPKNYKKESVIILYFLIFIILYYVASTANHVTATVRYQISLYPLAMIVSAIGIYQLVNIKIVRKYLKPAVVLSLILIASFFSLYSVRPFFLTYSSMFLPDKYVLNLKDMGDGSYEAAEYLNHLPGARNLIIWSDKGGVCEAFVGHCIIGFRENDLNGIEFNYFVSSIGRKSRSLKMYHASIFNGSVNFSKLYSSESQGIFKVEMNGQSKNFVKIERAEDLAINQN